MMETNTTNGKNAKNGMTMDDWWHLAWLDLTLSEIIYGIDQQQDHDGQPQN